MEEDAGVDRRRLEERLACLGVRVDRRHDSGPPVWLRQDGMDRAVVASAAVEGVVAVVRGADVIREEAVLFGAETPLLGVVTDPDPALSGLSPAGRSSC